MREKTVIRSANDKDASFIAWSLIQSHNLPKKREKHIVDLCSSTDSLFSWKNAIIAEIQGIAVGCLVYYTGKDFEAKIDETWKAIWPKMTNNGISVPQVEDSCVIDSLNILPSYRKKGIARKLIESAQTFCSQNSLNKIFIAVDINIDANYEVIKRLGWQEVGCFTIAKKKYTWLVKETTSSLHTRRKVTPHKLVYNEVIEKSTGEENKIDEDIVILDNYRLDTLSDYDFVAKGNYFIHVIKGSGYIMVNSVKYTVKAPCLLMFLDGQHIKTSITKDTLQQSVFFSRKFMEGLFVSSAKYSCDIRSTVTKNPVIKLDKTTERGIEMYMQALKPIAHYPGSNQIICATLISLALFYGPLYPVLTKDKITESFRSPKISSMFFSFLEENYRQEHRLAFYADKLNISERYLYVAITSTTGKSPGYWIDYYLISEAKRLLSDTSLSILQVCQKLNFAGLSSFGKFFTRKEGLSPREYRKKLSMSEYT